jgi:glycine betaine/proline transport system ATP-binding protein
MTENTDEGVVVTRNLWKILGARADEAMAAVRAEDLSKAEVTNIITN